MSFRTEEQQALVCRALLARVGLARLWEADGPSREAVARLKSGSGSSSEALMLRVAFDVWNGKGKAPLDRVLHVFDRANMEAIASLLVAFTLSNSGSAVDAWLVRYGACCKDCLHPLGQAGGCTATVCVFKTGGGA